MSSSKPNSPASAINTHPDGSNLSQTDGVKSNVVSHDTDTGIIVKHISKNVENRLFFTEYNISLFKRLLATPEDYAYHMKSLWLLRDLIHKQIDPDCVNIVRTNPLFPFLETVNEIIGCLLTGSVHFDFDGKAYEVVDGQIVYLPCKESY